MRKKSTVIHQLLASLGFSLSLGLFFVYVLIPLRWWIAYAIVSIVLLILFRRLRRRWATHISSHTIHNLTDYPITVYFCQETPWGEACSGVSIAPHSSYAYPIHKGSRLYELGFGRVRYGTRIRRKLKRRLIADDPSVSTAWELTEKHGNRIFARIYPKED